MNRPTAHGEGIIETIYSGNQIGFSNHNTLFANVMINL